MRLDAEYRRTAVPCNARRTFVGFVDPLPGNLANCGEFTARPTIGVVYICAGFAVNGQEVRLGVYCKVPLPRKSFFGSSEYSCFTADSSLSP